MPKRGSVLDEPPRFAICTLPASVTWMHGAEAPPSASAAEVTPVSGLYAAGMVYGQSFHDHELALPILMLYTRTKTIPDLTAMVQPPELYRTSVWDTECYTPKTAA